MKQFILRGYGEGMAEIVASVRDVGEFESQL